MALTRATRYFILWRISPILITVFVVASLVKLHEQTSTVFCRLNAEDSWPSNQNGDNVFVLLSKSKLQKFIEVGKGKENNRKEGVRNNQTGLSNSAQLPTKIAGVEIIKDIKIVKKPNLSRMINSSQSVTTLTAPYHFENTKLCTSVNDLAVLVIIHTACKNFQRRLSIRQTWTNSSYYEKDVRTLFLVGLTAKADKKMKRDIEEEFKKYGDLLVGDFNDTYHNLTLKGVMAYKWIMERCQNAKMILKVDDDITVNMFRFFEDIYPKYVKKRLHIICNHINSGSMPILRDKKSKWFVHNRHFKGYATYPTDYCSGFFVLFTSDLIPLLFASAKITPFFWVDDVYLYGLVPGNVPGVQYIGLQGNWHMLGGQDALRCYKNVTNTCPFLAIGVGSTREPEDVWHEILKRQALSFV